MAEKPGIAPSVGSLWSRGLIAIALLFGFYAFALGMVAFLLWLVYLQVRVAGFVSIKLVALCIGAAGAILWALRPRFDRFEPRGFIRLSADQEPRLFQLISEVAVATNQPPPDEVHLIGDVNAFVVKHGSIYGIGGRRILALGLPLMQMLTVAELRAVVAHEFGHFSGGDVRIAPIVYGARQSIIRTLKAVEGTWLVGPFGAYWEVFLNVSSKVSRWQEFAADRLAASVAGRSALAGGLRSAAAGHTVFAAYVNSGLRPVLETGSIPPIVDGFTTFLGTVSARSFVEQFDADRAGVTGDATYDTHPPLQDRIRAIADIADRPTKLDDRGRASSLLSGSGDHESLMLDHLGLLQRDLRKLPWASVAREVSLPRWRAQVESFERVFSGLSWRTLPSSVDRTSDLALRTKVDGEAYVPLDELRLRLFYLVGANLAVELESRHWSVSELPGVPVTAALGDRTVEPFVLVRELMSGVLSRDEWVNYCDSWGLPEELGAKQEQGDL